MIDGAVNGRDCRVDFLRGVALLVVFSDHIPENAVAQWTPAVLGMSDMAEVFVFLSGYVCGASDSRRLEEQRFGRCLLRSWSRALQILISILIASFISLGVLVAFEETIHPRFVGVQWSLDQVKSDPLETFWLIETLQLELHPLCVLALYVPLLIALPFYLAAFRCIPWLSWGLTALLYVASQRFPGFVTLPDPWRLSVSFNPFAWQFLFFSAASLGAAGVSTRRLLRPRWPTVLLAAGGLIILAWPLGGFSESWTRKSSLGGLRLLHFLCMLVVGWRLIPSSAALCRAAVCRPFIACGRSPLMAYCSGVILGILGEAAFVALSRNGSIQVLVNIFGWSGCIAAASLWRIIRGDETVIGSRQPRPVERNLGPGVTDAT